MKTAKSLLLAKLVVFLLAALPFLYLLYAILKQPGLLGANPAEYLTHQTGAWSLRFILLTLAVTPLRKLSGKVVLIKFRRMLGLYAFFYVSLHLLVYVFIDLGRDWGHLTEDILERPFMTIGFLAWLLLIPLAVTSNRYMMRRLGKRWKKLHRLVYVIGTLACIHYLWLVKKDLQEPLIYTAIFIGLMLFRLPPGFFRKRQHA